MPTPDDPYIKVEYHNGTEWTDITDYMKKKKGFVIEDGGLSEVGRLKLTLKPLDLALGHHIKITADVGQGQHLIFYGRLVKCVARTIGGKSDTYEIEATAHDMLERLVNDTITWEYYKEQKAVYPIIKWSYKSVIEDFLSNPDSSFDTGFTLDCGDQTTSPEMYDPVDGACNFERQSLLEALRTILENIGYDGYLDIQENPVIFVRKIGSIAANPAITLNPPYVFCELENSLDNVINVVHCKGGIDIGVPYDEDRFTERTIERYPNSWVIDNTETESLEDASNEDINETYRKGSYCIKATGQGTFSTLAFHLNIEEVLGAGNYLDMQNRIASLGFVVLANNNERTRIKLEDADGNKIAHFVYNHFPSLTIKQNETAYFSLPTPAGQQGLHIVDPEAEPSADITDNWWFKQGNAFDWSKVSKIYFLFEMYSGTGNPNTVYIDALLGEGGYEIDPFKHPDLNPAVYDQDSVDMYGVRLMWINDSSICSFEQASAEKNRIINNLKDPIPTLKIQTNTAFTWLRPNQCITVNVSQFGISNETWRPAKVIHVYRNGRLRTNLELVKQTDMIPPLWAKQPFLYPFIK